MIGQIVGAKTSIKNFHHILVKAIHSTCTFNQIYFFMQEKSFRNLCHNLSPINIPGTSTSIFVCLGGLDLLCCGLQVSWAFLATATRLLGSFIWVICTSRLLINCIVYMIYSEVAGVPFKLTSYIPYISFRCVASFRRSLLKAGPMPFSGRKAAGHGREAPCKGDVGSFYMFCAFFPSFSGIVNGHEMQCLELNFRCWIIWREDGFRMF